MTAQPESAWARFRRQKREWKQYKARVQALPPNYRMVMEAIQKHIWNVGGLNDGTQVLSGILELLEEGVANGRPVLAVTGDDVAAFCSAVLAEVQAATWAGKKGTKLNEHIHQQLKDKEDDRDQQ